MGFATIGAWIDSRIDKAGNSWRGSIAKKAIDDVIARSRKAAEEVTDKVTISAKEAKENFEVNLARINEQNKGKSFLRKAYEIGKQGGLIGLMMKKGSVTVSSESPKAQSKPMKQVDGWNIAH